MYLVTQVARSQRQCLKQLAITQEVSQLHQTVQKLLRMAVLGITTHRKVVMLLGEVSMLAFGSLWMLATLFLPPMVAAQPAGM